jgi:hypothetical protein
MSPRVSAGLAVLVLSSASLGAQTVSIDHQALGCAVAEKFPRLEARFAPADNVANARILFQPESSTHWYAVAMKPEGPLFSGVLPKPKKSLKAYSYYIEVTDRAMATSRTSDYTTRVVGGASECQGKVMAAGLGSASVLLQVPLGAAALPAGFASAGVVAAGGSVAAATGAGAASGGGLSTSALVAVVAGAGAAAAGVAVVASKGGEESVVSATTKTYSGSFSGQMVVTQTFTALLAGGVGTYDCLHTHAYGGTMTVTLEESNGTTTGKMQQDGTDTSLGVSGGPLCSSPGPGNFLFFFCTLTGPPSDLSCGSQTTATNGSRTSTVTHRFSGALSGGVITGTVTYAVTGLSSFPSGTAADSGSMSYSVTLR